MYVNKRASVYNIFCGDAVGAANRCRLGLVNKYAICGYKAKVQVQRDAVCVNLKPWTEKVVGMDTSDKAKEKRKVTVPVKIMGESFLITGTEDEGYVISLAKELDGKLAEARKLMPSASPHRIAISVALELISQTRKERKKSDSLLDAIERT